MKVQPPKPDVMPINRTQWFGQLHLSNFINSYYQFRDIQVCDEVKNILIVGPGQGLDTQILRWRGFDVSTLDIDETFKPDFMGSVHNLDMFQNRQFDVVIASHVLEHMAAPYLDLALSELSRVARWSIIYLPVAGKHFQLRLIPGFKGIDVSFFIDFLNFFDKPSVEIAKYCGGQHFWEVGLSGFRVNNLIKRFNENFLVVKHYRNHDWNLSYNFILKSKRH